MPTGRVLTQDLGSGELRLVPAPLPDTPVNGLLVRTLASLVSAGTERMLVDFGRANLLEKARSQPERVRDVIDKARTEGVAETIDAVRSKLAQPIPLGYANAGVVIAARGDVRGFEVGDVVATNGPHAEIVDVPATMAAKVPASVDPTHACFATVASVGLEAIRLARCEIGERFVVTGLGLVGLLTVQLLRAQGCAVLGVDPAADRRKRAESFGAMTAEPAAAEAEAERFSHGMGVDGVLICASTKSSDPVRAAARMCRQRGRIVLVGVAGLELDRAELYDKELSFQVSRAYGPGRYDPAYESGEDYPFGYVRWTAGRNMQAVVDLIASGSLDLASLVTHRFAFDDAASAYSALVDDRSAVGIVLEYPEPDTPDAAEPANAFRSPTASKVSTAAPSLGAIAVIGAGNFTARTLIPAIEDAGRRVEVIAARGGVSAAISADKIGARATSDVDALFDDESIGSVFIATRHDSHACLAAAAIDAGKAAYVEKPLALTTEQLTLVTDALNRAAGAGRVPVVTVGFNRRFSPITVRMRELLRQVPGPKTVIATVNAGAMPADHWTQDPDVGGGRILGEGCHFIDLARHLVGHPITDVSTVYLDTATRDSATVTLSFADGSTATIHYLATGSARFPKERIEVFAGGRVLVNDNFKTLHPYGWKGVRAIRLRRQDKGHKAAVAAFLHAAANGGPPPIPIDELLEVSAASIRAADPSR